MPIIERALSTSFVPTRIEANVRVYSSHSGPQMSAAQRVSLPLLLLRKLRGSGDRFGDYLCVDCTNLRITGKTKIPM